VICQLILLVICVLGKAAKWCGTLRVYG